MFRLRIVFSVVFAFSLLSCVLCGAFAVDVSAAVNLPQDGHYMTQSDALAIFGSQIECTYFDGTDYVDDVFTYDTTRTLYAVDDPDLPLTVGQTVLVYTAHVAANQNAQYVTFRLNPQYSIFDTEYLYCACGLSSGFSVSSSAYNSPSWKWYGGGQEVIFSGDYVDNNGDRRCVGLWLNDWQTSGISCTAVPAIFDFSGSSSSCYSIDCQFRGNSSYGTDYYFFISLPYVSGDAFGSSGTIGTTSSGGGSGTGDINVDVTVDMEETNSWLSDIWDAISGLASSLLSGIVGLFVPSESDFMEFIANLRDDFSDAFDPVFPSFTVIIGLFNTITEHGSDTGAYTLTFPEVDYYFSGTLFHFGGMDVPLVPSGLGNFANIIKGVIDIVCTIAVYNTIMKKFEIFLNPEAETIIE